MSKTSNRLFVDLHAIQTVPPSCVNRDDTGSPKTAVYGGVTRARVSSQSWKRAIRDMFKDYFDEADLGVRTKKIVDMVATEIRNRDSSIGQDEAKKLAEKVINKADVTTKDGEAKALFFMSKKQAENLANLALTDADPDKRSAIAALNKDTGVDIALFGRMVADNPSLNTDATVQVAHSISTHAVSNEYDFFTAVDDKSPEDTAGAGMLGTVEFNSSTLYRYATLAAHELFIQLASDSQALAKVVAEFARAFVASMPTGKQNTFANRTLPSAVMVSLRADQPLNLVDAFEEPVKGEGLAKKSAQKLIAHANKVYQDFSTEPQAVWAIGDDLADCAEYAGERVTFDRLLDALGKEMLKRFSAIEE